MARAKRGTKKVETEVQAENTELVVAENPNVDTENVQVEPAPEPETENVPAETPPETNENEPVVEGTGTSQVEEEVPRPGDACDSYPDCSPESAECLACLADFPDCFAICERETKRKRAPKPSGASRTTGRKGKSVQVATGPVIVSGYGTHAGSLRALYTEYVTMGLTNEQIFAAMIDGFRTRYPERKGLDEKGFEKWVLNRIKGQTQWLRARQKKSDAPANTEQQDSAVNE